MKIGQFNPLSQIELQLTCKFCSIKQNSSVCKRVHQDMASDEQAAVLSQPTHSDTEEGGDGWKEQLCDLVEWHHEAVGTKLHSYEQVAIVAIFLAGFAISDMNGFEAGDMTDNAVWTYAIAQCMTINLTVFAAFSMVFVIIITRRAMASDIADGKIQPSEQFWRNILQNDQRAIQSHIHFKGCKIFGIHLSNWAWHAVLLAIPLYFVALMSKMTSALQDQGEGDLLIIAGVILFACPVTLILVITIINKRNGRFGCTVMIESWT
eukprot:g3256.t1